jgi:hypothetical protein
MARGATFATVTGLVPVLLSSVPGGHLGVESTVGDLLRHPAFAGFARLIPPWDGRFGLGARTRAEGWVFEAIRFWEKSIGKHSSISSG